MDIDLQQRAVEFSQLFKAHSNLRPALLEKMPPMQVSRVSNQNSDIIGENDSDEPIINGTDGTENANFKIPSSNSVRNVLVFS